MSDRSRLMQNVCEFCVLLLPTFISHFGQKRIFRTNTPAFEMIELDFWSMKFNNFLWIYPNQQKKKQWIRYFEIESKLETTRASSSTTSRKSKQIAWFWPYLNQSMSLLRYSNWWVSNHNFQLNMNIMTKIHTAPSYNGHRRSRNFTAFKCTISDWAGYSIHVVNSSDWVSLSSFLSQSFSHTILRRSAFLLTIGHWTSTWTKQKLLQW